MKLYTIGYGGSKSAEEFYERIPEGVTIIDVRNYAGSAYPKYLQWFGKTAMKKQLFGRYYHYRALGNPMRELPWTPFSTGAEGIAMGMLDLLATEILNGCTLCLLCACRDADKCHRSDIARELQARVEGLEVVNL